MPLPELQAIENPSAEALLDSLKTIGPAERRKHASVFNYWLSIRGKNQFPPIRDLDPLEISDAGPWSVLLEMVGGGDDAIVRHFGNQIGGAEAAERVAESPAGSLLATIHGKLPIVAACREAFAFEDSCDTGTGPARCWVTLLPFSSNGSWIDYVYGYVSLEGDEGEAASADGEDAAPPVAVEPEAEAEPALEAEAEADGGSEPIVDFVAPEVETDEAMEAAPVVDFADPEPETELEAEPVTDAEPEPEPEPEAVVEAGAEPVVDFVERDPAPVVEFDPEPQIPDDPQEAEPEAWIDADEDVAANDSKPSFTAKVMESLASVGGFYGKVTQSMAEQPEESFAEPAFEPDAAAVGEPTFESEDMPFAEAPADPGAQPAMEASLQSKLTDVRTLAEEAREAQVRSNMALYEGLSAAYDFALDAEDEPEEYLRLVEAQGLKIQLRSPMKPVVKLAFDGMCDEPTIQQLEAVLAWALKNDLPRGSLAARIQEEGGIGQILNAKAA